MQKVETKYKTCFDIYERRSPSNPAPRARWDAELLALAGFPHITIDPCGWQRTYREKDEFYDPAPGFAIAATA